MSDDLTPVVVPCGAVAIRIWHTTHYLETVWWPHTRAERRVPAAPNQDGASVALAFQLGYGGDTWRMSMQHECLHTWLAVQQGLEWSPTLHSVAYGYKPPKGLIPAEEATVLALQAALNGAPTDPAAVAALERATGRAVGVLVPEARAWLQQLDT